MCASQVAAKALETAVFGAYYNVMINLKDITDDGFKQAVGLSTDTDALMTSDLICPRPYLYSSLEQTNQTLASPFLLCPAD